MAEDNTPMQEAEQVSTSPPGEGERRAQRGYTRQYRAAGAAIYDGLDRGDLQWVGLADRNAGIADDVVLGYPGRVIGHQFKTSQFAQRFTLRTLFFGAEGLFDPLITAWKELNRNNPGLLVEVRLVTNDIPSTDDSLIGTKGFHSAAFLSEFELHSTRFLAEWRDTAWGPWIHELLTRSGLEDEAFELFLRSLKVLHGPAADFVLTHRLSSDAARLANEIATKLPLLVADPRNKDQWSRAELLQELGWRDAAVTRHAHQFPIGAYVQRNLATEQALREAIHRYASGYVSLIGPPGAGKSTLLQASLEAEEGVFLVRYLAYVPGIGQGVGRGEANDFFDDINTHLKNTGLSGLKFRDDTLHDRRTQFETLLERAGQRFAKYGQRTLIIIDGLDHVPREEIPERSFLAELPLPGAIPDGVLIILGTQRVDLDGIRPAVRDQAGSAGRSITVQPLAREAVYRMADRLGLDGSIDREQIFDLSSGHPLVARYLIEAVRETDESGRKELLAGAIKFEGDLEAVYESAWRTISESDQARGVLDYLARAEGAMPLELLTEAVAEQAIELALRATRHLLNESPQGWMVFHNSFRLFILNKPKMRLGRVDPGYSKRIYESLATMARVAPADSQQRWLELRYLARAENHVQVLALALPERFRQQVAERRAFAELRADLRLAFASAQHSYSPLMVFQLMLIQDEVERRWGAYEEARSLPEALLAIGDLDGAVAFVEDIPDCGYEVVDALLKKGDVSRARTLFDSLEPLQQLMSGATDRNSLEVSELQEWAQRVIHFRDLDQILAAIDRLSRMARLPGTDTDEDYEDLVSLLRGEVALSIIVASPETDKVTVIQDLELEGTALVTFLILASAIHADRGASGVAVEYLQAAHAREDFEAAYNALRRRAALTAAKCGDIELAIAIHRGLTVPEVAELDDLTGDDSSEHMVRAVLEHAELTAMLGQCAPVVSKESAHHTLRPLQIHAATSGELLGRAQRDPSAVHANEVARAARSALTYLDKVKPSGSHEFYSIHQIAAASPVLGKALLQAAALCGEDEFQATLAVFDEAFAKPPSNHGPRANLRRQVAEQLFHWTGDTERASLTLESLVSELLERTPAAQIEEISFLATSFARVGNLPRAHELLACIPDESLGSALAPKKDGRYSLWRDLLQQANAADPSRRSERVAQIMRQMSGMAETDGDASAYRMSQVVLEEAVLCDCATGWSAGQRLVADGLIGWPLLIDSLLVGLVKRNPQMALVATATWCTLSLPYYMEKYFYEHRLGLFVSVVVEAASADDIQAAIDLLLPAIEAHARAHERIALLERLFKAVAGRGVFCDALSAACARWAAEALPSRHSATPMRFDHVQSLEDLKQQLAGSSPNEFGYEASRAFVRLVPDSCFATAQELFDKQESIQRDPRARLTLIDLAIADGKVGVARELFLGYKEVAEGAASWVSWIGGNLRQFYSAKLKLDGPGVRREAYDSIVGGLASGRESVSLALLEQEEIFQVLVESPDFAGMWSCLAEQLVSTREHHLGAEFITEGSQDEVDLIVSMLVWALDLSVPEVRRHAISGVLSLRSVPGGDIVFLRLLRRLFAGEADQPAVGIHLLLHCADALLAAELGDEILRLTQHADIAVAEGAIHLAKGWGLSPPRRTEQLPAFYSFALNEGEEFSASQLADSAGAPMRVEDPLGWTAAFKTLIGFLERFDISPTHVRERCSMFIKRWGGLETFGANATQQLLSELRTLEMKMTYVRPHMVGAARAMRYVAGELRAGGVIPDQAIPHLLYLMNYPTPPALQISPIARPPFILRPPLDTTHWQSEADDWRKNVEEDIAPLNVAEGTILVEICEFYFRKAQTTFDMKRVRAPGLPSFDRAYPELDEYELLPRAVWAGSPVPLSSEPSETMVRMLSTSWNQDLPRVRLVICPHWLAALAWLPSPSNHMEYVDQDNNVVARIVWWRDGGPVDGDEECIWGEGTYIILTPEGRGQLERLTGPLEIDVYARRRTASAWRDEGRVQMAGAASTEP
ncbi:AAA family ATPase [Pseudomonas sp. TCU-HL1]|uniref:AAA family ATPase n=1 Tax=Pseudomonas sp. TCU-HL1 TaxID=1856685 RepID=UPI00083DCB64|nr:ATP-binding protein [Pseudomonas sp. TCU-HL1]AOE85923.1 hypothetical protein THL1_3375 [Pseudomonas sp. TCU-HL1]